MASPRGGYPLLATWIARDPDNESFIFRKFDRLSARTLLHQQSQLIALEAKLDRLDEESCGDLSSRRWETFVEKSADTNAPESERLEVTDEIQDKLKEYHETLLRQSRIVDLDRPSIRALSAFRKWCKGGWQEVDAFGNKPAPKPVIYGGAKNALDDTQDLVALPAPADKDPLSRFLQDHWPSRDSRLNPQSGTSHFLERHVQRAVVLINIIVAAHLLTGAITSLYFVTSPGASLGMLAGFQLLFAISISLMTNASRAEIFAATAAYSAVLVVFVSGNLGNTNMKSTG